MFKRGISPLIATVLLIGFVVAVAGVAMMWTRGFVGEIQEKRGAEATASLSCSTDVKITVRSADYGTVSVQNDRGRIDGFLLVISGDGGSQTIESTSGVDSGGILNIEFEYDSSLTGGLPKKLDVIPRIKLGKGVYQPCPNQKITWNYKRKL